MKSIQAKAYLESGLLFDRKFCNADVEDEREVNYYHQKFEKSLKSIKEFIIMILDYLLLSITFGLTMVSSAVSEFSAEKCRELGFNKANLFCSSCEKLNHFNLTELEAPCKECCQGDTDLVETKKYPKAVLEVCG
ncbi:selenoprotein F-like [Artemia franciscana]|uniref:selenoprotein F-like n=1 Tax=Artemia franciscana TaxID=6661 RepID=UPI0032DA7C36